jgi:hypothetical protein
MQNIGNDFNEEMHVLVYELVKATTREEIDFFRNSDKHVPLYSVYMTNDKDLYPKEIPNMFATYPTVDGFMKLAEAVFLHESDLNNLHQQKNQLNTVGVRDVFIQEDFEDLFWKEVFYHVQLQTQANVSPMVPNNTMQIQERYRRLKKEFQDQHPIRFAVLGGLHRCGLSVHMLGNYVIRNGPPLQNKEKDAYFFTAESSLNTKVPVHLFSPLEQKIDLKVLQRCENCSRLIQLRKTESFGTTIKAQLFDLLKSTPEQYAKLRTVRDECFNMEGEVIFLICVCFFLLRITFSYFILFYFIFFFPYPFISVESLFRGTQQGF